MLMPMLMRMLMPMLMRWHLRETIHDASKNEQHCEQCHIFDTKNSGWTALSHKVWRDNGKISHVFIPRVSIIVFNVSIIGSSFSIFFLISF